MYVYNKYTNHRLVERISLRKSNKFSTNVWLDVTSVTNKGEHVLEQREVVCILKSEKD